MDFKNPKEKLYSSNDLYKVVKILDIRYICFNTGYVRKNLSNSKPIDHRYQTRSKMQPIIVPRMCNTIDQRSLLIISKKLVMLQCSMLKVQNFLLKIFTDLLNK